MKINDAIIKDAEVFITRFLLNETPEGYTFHTLDHTLDEVKNADLIGAKEKLTEDEMNILRIAACLHD